MARLETDIWGATLGNPLMVASGTFGFGEEFLPYQDIGALGAVVVKGITWRPREGNPPGRLQETPSGLLNCIGLQNPGVEAFCREIWPRIREVPTCWIVNISGETPAEYGALAERLDAEDIGALEVNVSCPNVAAGGMAFGTDPRQVARITREVRRRTGKPVIVKLSPNVTDITAPARAAEEAGADAVSLINTLLGMEIDVERGRPALSNVFGGLSGPAIRPVGLRMVYQVYQALTIPVIGIGGIVSARDVVAYLMAGARAVQLGTANLVDPSAAAGAIAGLREWMDSHGVEEVGELVGRAHGHKEDAK